MSMMAMEIMKTAGGGLKIYPDGPEWDGKASCTFGNISFKTRYDGAALLRDAIDRIRGLGRDRVLAPMEGDTWHSYRLVSDSDGSAPFMLEPTSKAHDRQAFLDAGFAPISRYFSTRLDLNEWGPLTPSATDAFRIQTWDGTDAESLFGKVYQVSTKAFAGNKFYKHISEDDFLAMYMPLVDLIKREFVLFARRPDGDLAGFLFAIPNYAEGPMPKTVIVKTYASLLRGAGRHLLYSCHASARAMGYQMAIHALMHETNESAERSARDGAKVFRRYELLGLRLDG